MAFSISLVPRGKGRPRTAVRGRRATIYTDEATREYEAQIKRAVEKVMGDRAPYWQALSIFLKIRIPVPVSYSKRERTAILAGEANYFGAYDADNMVKAFQDGGNGVLYDDDKQICQLVVVRIPSEKPGIDVRISEFNPKDWI